MPSPWLTVNEAAEYMRRSVKHVYRLVETGRLASCKPDRLVLIHQDDIEKFYKKNMRRVRA